MAGVSRTARVYLQANIGSARPVPSEFVPMPQFTAFSDFAVGAESLRGFLGRPANLPLISNPDLELEILAAPELIAAGQRIEFRITAWGLKQKAIHQYTDAEALRIVEVLTEGAMRFWRHSQTLDVIAPDTCRLTDEIEFEPPGGMLGYLLTEDRIRESLEEGMDFRYSAIRELISSGIIH